MSIDNFLNLDGWVEDKEAVQTVLKSLKTPYFGDIIPIKGTGRGKITLLHKAVEKVAGYFYIYLQEIGDCVANAQAGAITSLSAIEIFNGDMESFGGIIAPEPIYGDGRHLIGKDQISGDGLVSAWACQATQKYGTVVQGKYGNIDLTKYSGARAREWGSRKGVPQELKQFQKNHLVKTFTQINSYEEAIDAIASGYPIVFGAQAGFSTVRDKYGFARRAENWSHSQYIISADDTTRPGLLVVNSWGKNWISGPKRYEQPDGTYWITPEDANYIFRQGDSWAISSYDGFPVKKFNLKRWGGIKS